MARDLNQLKHSRPNHALRSVLTALSLLAHSLCWLGCTAKENTQDENPGKSLGRDATAEATVHDPTTREPVLIDRFAPGAATLMVRTAENGLPDAGEAIDFDETPFISQGYGPTGQVARYYNFDVQPQVPGKMYVFVRKGMPLAEQLPLVDRIPGSAGYSDIWRIYEVAVEEDYVANQIAGVSELESRGYEGTATDRVVNRPLVPAGSRARERARGEASELKPAFYEGKLAYYFEFESDLVGRENARGKFTVGSSYIFVAFNVNPGLAGGGASSGFKTEPGSAQTHNVLATLPGEEGYSPLWAVKPYDNAAFEDVKDLASADDAPALPSEGTDVVNCPVNFSEE